VKQYDAQDGASVVDLATGTARHVACVVLIRRLPCISGIDPARGLTLVEVGPSLEHGVITCNYAAVPRHPMHTPLGDQRGNTQSRHTKI
jgi:hypothetical protein